MPRLPLQVADEKKAFLGMPQESYLFVPEPIRIEQFAGSPHRVTARKYDFTRNAAILVVSKR